MLTIWENMLSRLPNFVDENVLLFLLLFSFLFFSIVTFAWQVTNLLLVLAKQFSTNNN